MDFPPKPFCASQGRGRHIFWATATKLHKFVTFLQMYKSYYYHFWKYLAISKLQKMLEPSSPGVQSFLAYLRPYSNCFEWKFAPLRLFHTLWQFERLEYLILALNQIFLQDIKFGCKNLLNFICHTMKFHNCHHTSAYRICGNRTPLLIRTPFWLKHHFLAKNLPFSR